jgi:nicotinate-nucleotide--dimethylbenzimidazole phosphoribosyltransferase
MSGSQRMSTRTSPTVPAVVARLVDAVPAVDREAADAARAVHASLATPPGALGDVEELGARLAAIAGRCPPPPCHRSELIVAAADHGVHAQGISPWPQTVTAAMVRTLCEGRASANAFAGTVGAGVTVLDVGLAHPVDDHPRLRRAAVRPGARDLAGGPAMTDEECTRAVLAGADAASGLIEDGADLLLTGDMGICNTTAAAALVAGETGLCPEQVTGPGAGTDPGKLARKQQVVAAAVARHRHDQPWARLAGVGGLEHAALVGVLLAAAPRRVPVVLDGVNALAAALSARALAPDLAGHLLASHRSTEPAAAAALSHLDLRPLLDLGLRLGEGTGALLAVPILRAAAALLTEVATLDDVLSA